MEFFDSTARLPAFIRDVCVKSKVVLQTHAFLLTLIGLRREIHFKRTVWSYLGFSSGDCLVFELS